MGRMVGCLAWWPIEDDYVRSPQRCSMVCVVRKWYSLLTRNLSIVTVGSVLVGKVVEQ